MRVLVVTNQYPIPGRPSFGAFVAEQVRSLVHAGVTVDVVFFNPKQTRLNYGLSLPRVVHAIRSASYDILHTHHTYSMLLVDAARRLVRSQIPIVLTNHEGEVTDTENRARTFHPTSWLRYSLFVKRIAARRADFVILVSQRAADLLAVDAPRDIIPCGVDLAKFAPLDRGKCRSQLGIPRDALVIFFPAGPQAEGKRFALAKAAYDLVRARVREAVLITAGEIPHQSMPLYYNAADVVLQASFYEASPTVVKEALACEVPIVSTDSGDTREMVDGVPFCFVCRDDPMDLAEHVLKCATQRAVGGREQLQKKGLSLEQVAQRLIRVYERVIAESVASHTARPEPELQGSSSQT